MWAWLTVIGFTIFIGQSAGAAALENNRGSIRLASIWVIVIWAVMFLRREWIYVVTWGVLATMLVVAIGWAVVYKGWMALKRRK
jgi:hypothetical protein